LDFEFEEAGWVSVGVVGGYGWDGVATRGMTALRKFLSIYMGVLTI
jgi:hypothetical protein